MDFFFFDIIHYFLTSCLVWNCMKIFYTSEISDKYFLNQTKSAPLAPHLQEKKKSQQDNMSVQYLPSYTPLLYSKTEVCTLQEYTYLFFIQNIDCGYSLEPTIYVFSKKRKIYFFPTENFFYNFKNLSTLHGPVLVMSFV